MLDRIWYAVVVARFRCNEKVQLHPTAFKVEKHALDGRPRYSELVGNLLDGEPLKGEVCERAVASCNNSQLLLLGEWAVMALVEVELVSRVSNWTLS